MAGDPIVNAFLEVDGDQIELDSVEIKPEDDAQFVTAMTRSGEPIGVSSGNRRYTITAEATIREDEDVDLHDLWESKSNVPTDVEFENGDTWAFSNGRISNPTPKANHGEPAKWSFDILCWGLQIS
jgi:hypothetical protein